MTNEDKAKQLYRKYRDMNFAPESAAFNAAMEMAQWKDEQVKQEMIEKAVEWMKDHAYDYSFMGDTCIEEFKQAMKGE